MTGGGFCSYAILIFGRGFAVFLIIFSFDSQRILIWIWYGRVNQATKEAYS
jgi:hypothetical protein